MNGKYSYMGIGTSLNGLLNWMENNIYIRGNKHIKAQTRRNYIIKFARIHIEKFTRKGSGTSVADLAARMIKTQGRFHQFTTWVKTYNEEQQRIENTAGGTHSA